MGHTGAVDREFGGEKTKSDRYATRLLSNILDEAGVTLDGPEPWDPQLNDPRAVRRMIGGGSLGIGEAYMDGEWDCDRLDELARRIMLVDGVDRLLAGWRKALHLVYDKLVNRQNQQRATAVAELHYNLDARFFEQILGESMVYSCAYWRDADSLTEAQLAKLDLVCRKLDLQPNDRLLDIGCGWGSLANHAAEHYGCEVVGVSIAAEQVAFAKERFTNPKIRFVCDDYRSLPEYDLKPFDKIASVGMFEHVGTRNYETFMNIVDKQLRTGGRFLLHTILGKGQDPWLTKYIFPNGVLCDLQTIMKSVPTSLVLEDLQNLRSDYGKTLHAWYDNLNAAREVDERLQDDRFYRMWRFYLLTSVGGFTAGSRLQVDQMLFTKGGAPETIIAPR